MQILRFAQDDSIETVRRGRLVAWAGRIGW